MIADEKMMHRCIELARLGLGKTAPNPMVGAVIVHKDRIIGEGFHQKYGEAHAEVNAIGSVQNKDLLSESTLYVSLEPCSHRGKTPPCTGLIIEMGIPEVVIGIKDSFPEVAGKGIEKLQMAGIKVITGILENECRELNIRFFTFHEKHRPYIILKWAQTKDGFVDRMRSEKGYGEPNWITGAAARKLVHKYRAEEAAIMVGINTVIADNPMLTTRDWPGSNPIRIVIDRTLKLPLSMKVFEPPTQTIVINSLINKSEGNLQFIKLEFDNTLIKNILNTLYNLEIQSLIVEGGPTLLNGFIHSNLWDEARVFQGNISFGSGIIAPEFNFTPVAEEWIGSDLLRIYRNI